MFTNPDAAPASRWGAASIANAVTCGIARPKPIPITTKPGATCERVAAVVGQRDHGSIPADEQHQPADQDPLRPNRPARRSLTPSEATAIAIVTGR